MFINPYCSETTVTHALARVCMYDESSGQWRELKEGGSRVYVLKNTTNHSIRLVVTPTNDAQNVCTLCAVGVLNS